MKNTIRLAGSGLLLFVALASAQEPKKPGGDYNVIVSRSAGLPVTVFNLTLRVGSADDPEGYEGIANLTARLVREGGVGAWNGFPARSRVELEEDLYPLAAEIGVQVAREQTSFQVTAPAQDAERVFLVLAQMFLAPAFDGGEFERLRAEELDLVTNQLPREDEEELGKAALEREVYGKGHPYAHVTSGTASGIRHADLPAVVKFFQTHYTRKRLTLGMAGVVTPRLEKIARAIFSGVPGKKSLELGESSRTEIPPARPSSNTRLTLVKGPFEAVGVHLGQPLDFNRASPKFPAMLLGSTAFGKHRSFVGRLMNVVREVRGLNYGTYSYIEEFPQGGLRMVEPTQVARTRQSFTVWARPTPLANGCFLLRQVYREVESLAAAGLTAKEFSLTQSHLVGSIPLLGMGLERQLGYAIDASFYGMPTHALRDLQKAVKGLRREQVNKALGDTLKPRQMQIVVVTPDPEAFRSQILSKSCAITYAEGVQKGPEVLAEDREISSTSLGLSPENIRIVPSENFFE